MASDIEEEERKQSDPTGSSVANDQNVGQQANSASALPAIEETVEATKHEDDLESKTEPADTTKEPSTKNDEKDANMRTSVEITPADQSVLAASESKRNESTNPKANEHEEPATKPAVITGSSSEVPEIDGDMRRLQEICTSFLNKTPPEPGKEGKKSDATDSILQLLVTEDLSTIKNHEALHALFIDYLSYLPTNVISEILSVLIAIVKKSVFNLELARGLLFSCIKYLTSDLAPLSSTQKHSIQDLSNVKSMTNQRRDRGNTPNSDSLSLTKHFLREWINLLVAHSCDVQELKSILKFSEHDSSLLTFIQQANVKQRNRPHAFFAFPGTRGSMLSLPPFQRWPIQLGWSFSTWFFLEPKACAQPYLFNFKTGKSGLGYSAHFTGNCLVLTSIRVKGKGVQHCVAYEFPSYKWIHCAIAYHNKWRASEIKVYVNGQLTANIEMPWQVQTTEMFDKCFIGGCGLLTANDRSGELNCFCGQMSALHLFNEGLSPAQICALHRLGPSYMGQYKYSNESHVNLPPQTCRTLYQEKLSSSLFCLFSPVAVDSETLCIQLAPFKSSTSAPAQNYFVSAPHAALLGQTKAIITQPVCSTLQSLGCSRSLLPLLDVFAKKGNPEACASLIGFLCDLLESSPHWFANEIVQNNGFVLVSCALASDSSHLISDNFLDIILNLTRTLLTTASTAGDSLLLKHLMDNILFNPHLWVYANTKLQIRLYNYLATEFLNGTRQSSNKYTISNSANFTAYNPTSIAASAMYSAYSSSAQDETPHQKSQTTPSELGSNNSVISDLLFGEIRRVSTILQALHALKYYYWHAEEKSINQKARNRNLRPNPTELSEIRANILLFTKELIVRAHSTPFDEIQGLLNYLSSNSQAENLLDVLDMLSTLIVEQPTSMVNALDQKQGIKVMFTLLGSKCEQVRVKTLRLLSSFLSHCSLKKKQEIMGPNNLFMLLCDRLRIYKPLTLEVYEALVDLMIEESDSNRKLDDKRSREISKKKIENPLIIKVIASLLHEERSSKPSVGGGGAGTELGSSSREVQVKKHSIRNVFINDLWNIIVNSKDNRRTILQMSVWQHWLINLIDSELNYSQLVRDQILGIFRVLLYHAIRYEYGGWRVWIDTLAIIHAKVSFDEFCQQINRNSIETVERSASENECKPDAKLEGKRSQQSNFGEEPTKKVSDSDGGAQTVASISEQIPNQNYGIHMAETGVDEVDASESNNARHQENKESIKKSKICEEEKRSPTDTGPLPIESGADATPAKAMDASMDSVDLAPTRSYRRASVCEDGEAIDSEGTARESNELERQQSLTSIPLDDTNLHERVVEDHQEADERKDTIEDEVRVQPPQQQQHQTEDCGSRNNSGPSSLQSNTQKATASPAFRIPEFKWSSILVKMLNDLMFSVECDLYHWRCIAKMTSLDASPFVFKSASLAASQASSGATAANRGTSAACAELESILQKPDNQIYLINVIHLISQLADNVIIASGGLLPLLADATGGTRNATSQAADAKSAATSEGLSVAEANSILYRLVNMVDMVVVAAPHINLTELETEKNTTSGAILRQCLRLACTVVVKNCLVLRGLVSNTNVANNNNNGPGFEFPREMFDGYHGCSLLSVNGLFDQSALAIDSTDLIANVEYSPHQTPDGRSMPSLLPFQACPIKDTNKLLQAIDISRIQACIYHYTSTDSRQSQFLALSSLYLISVLMVSKYRDIIDPKHKSVNKSKSSSSQGSPAPSLRSDSSPVAGEATNQQPPQKPQEGSATAIPSIEANLLSFGKMQIDNSSQASSTTNSLTDMLTTKLESSLDTICPLLKSVMCDFSSFLSKTLIGTHGQDLVSKEAERTFKRSNTSSVELVMLLCSQEWQNTLQKNAGLAFIELINEGRVLSHGMKDHIVRVAMEAEFILSRLRADDVAKHEHFRLGCSETLSARLHEEVLINSLISSAARRDYMLYCKFCETVQNESRRTYKLDIWEDDDRRKRRFVFDSLDDSSQLFYVGQQPQRENNLQQQSESNVEKVGTNSTISEKADTQRILELQKSMELSGVQEHCSQPAPALGNNNSTSDADNAHGGDKYDDSDDDNYEDEDEAENHWDSASPHSDAGQGAVGSSRSKPAANLYGVASNSNSAKIHHESAHQFPAGAANKTATERNSQSTAAASKHDSDGGDPRSDSIWDCDDCGSMHDFTGSVVFAAECALIWSIYAIPGLLQLTTNELYFEPNQNITELMDAVKHSEAAESLDQQQHSEDCKSNSNTTEQENHFRKMDLKALRYCDFLTCNGKVFLSDIRAVFSRHYLTQPNALEIFLSQRTSIMFAFADFDSVKRVVKYLPPVGVGIKYGIAQSRRASLMTPRQLFAASNMTQRWQKREIGNFQYLMFLNTIAGRTYQDLNQYPVFPWILTNYESEELDLNLPSNFRDLSKPVGALNSKRRSDFIERYQSWDNPKIPAFHYGTHYSTAAFTLNWLCRLRGLYNSSYLALQDGKYEEDSRLFLSIGDSWVSSLVGGNQNVKELIPEFFYLPEMFHSNLGLPEIEYPPWAKSAEQFVRMHRIALESELVSCQLHQWIDLIFGYKQRGPEAIEAVNTFYYLTYQGNVNLNLIQDSTLREAIEAQIKHFGQTPSQLTNEPHPPRFSALHASPLVFAPSVDEVNKVIKFPFNNPIVHISSCINNYITATGSDSASTGTVPSSSSTNVPSSVLTITSNNQYQIHKWMPNDQSGHPLVIDPQLASQSSSGRRQLIDVDDLCPGIPLKLTSHKAATTKQLQAIVDEVQYTSAHYIVTLNGRYIIMGSFYDNSFRVFATESGKLCQVIYGHRAPVTCLSRSEGNASADFYIATGGKDCSVLIWTWNERFAQVEGSGVSAVHNPLPKLSISGHGTAVLSAVICAELGLIASGSKNLILVHTTTTGENLLMIDISLPDMVDRTLSESQMQMSTAFADCSNIQRPQVQDKQKTILEASMLGEESSNQQQNLNKQQRTTNLESKDEKLSAKDSKDNLSSSSLTSARDGKFSQLKDLCNSDYYITNLQFARELAFIVCTALPPPRKKATNRTSANELAVCKANSSPSLLFTFNLRGSLIDSTPIGQSVNSPRLGDVCVMQTTRDGEHLILNDSPTTIKIYRTFGLQPICAYNTNDIQITLSDDSNRVKSLALFDHKYILVGLESGKIVVYNSDFKNIH